MRRLLACLVIAAALPAAASAGSSASATQIIAARTVFRIMLHTTFAVAYAWDEFAATASVVGAIIGELPSGIQSGLGGAIINFNQYYSIEPQELWATNIIAAALGILFFLTVVLAEKLVVHRAPEVPA